MAAGVAEGLDHQVRAAIDHLGGIEEVGCDLDEAAELHHPAHAGEITRGGDPHLGDQVDAAEPRGLDRSLQIDLLADDPLDPTRSIRRHLAGDVDQVSGPHERDVVGHGRHRLRQGDPQRFQTLFDLRHQSSSSQEVLARARGGGKRPQILPREA